MQQKEKAKQAEREEAQVKREEEEAPLEQRRCSAPNKRPRAQQRTPGLAWAASATRTLRAGALFGGEWRQGRRQA